jgi:glycosyltransferase involved in cell wall biosynthesis
VVYVRDTVSAFWWATTLGPALAVPVIYEAHDLESTNPSRAKEPWAAGWVRGLDDGAIRASTLVASLTEDFRRLLAERGWRSPDEVVVIPDAFDDEALVVYAGMTFSYRRLDLLVSAFATVRARRPDARLVFVGGRSAEIAVIREQARERGLEGAVLLLGPRPQEEVRLWLQAADVLCIPDTVTDVTASPLKLFEYLAVERAVVLPDIPALREVLPESVGYYFVRGDEVALAAALLRALDDPERPARERAGREAVQPHTYAARAARILAAARQVSGRAQ